MKPNCLIRVKELLSVTPTLDVWLFFSYYLIMYSLLASHPTFSFFFLIQRCAKLTNGLCSLSVHDHPYLFRDPAIMTKLAQLASSGK